MRIVVTLELVSDVLRDLRVEHPDYPRCERLRTMSKDEMIFAFCEHPSDWCDRHLHHVRLLLKVLDSWTWWWLLFYTYSLTITLSQSLVLDFCFFLLEHLTIDFPSHFILSIIDVYRDTATRDKFIFPSAIMRILCHFFIPFPSSDHFSVMCAIDYTTVKWSEVQFRSRRSDTTAFATPSAPSTSTPSDRKSVV